MNDRRGNPGGTGEGPPTDFQPISEIESELIWAVFDLARSCMSMASMLAQVGSAQPEVMTREWVGTYRTALSAAVAAFDRIDKYTGRHKADP